MSLTTLPVETLLEIVALAVEASPDGSPTALYSMSLTCRHIFGIIHQNTQGPSFIAKVLRYSFDADPYHRIGRDVFVQGSTTEYDKYCSAIRVFKSVRRLGGDVKDPRLESALVTAYIMMLNDDGANVFKLRLVGLLEIVKEIIFSLDLSQNNGWPQADVKTSLAVILLWMLSNHASIRLESREEQDAILEALAPIIWCAFRYPCFGIPEHSFLLTHSGGSAHSVHGPYPPPRPPSVEFTFFGHQCTLNLPPMAPYAILSSMARIDTRPVHFDPRQNMPANRAAAIAMGKEGATLENWKHYHSHCMTRFITHGHGRKSRRHDAEWLRVIESKSFVPRPISLDNMRSYIPGTMAGRWMGTTMTPCLNGYQQLRNHIQAPVPFISALHTSRTPIYVTFAEHYCFSPQRIVPFDQSNVGSTNAFLPFANTYRNVGNEYLEILNHFTGYKTYYQTYHPRAVASPDDHVSDPSLLGVVDIIITGHVEPEEAAAFGAFNYVGRIRPSDGFVVLFREPANAATPGLGRSIFRGYIISSQNFVGRWRFCEHPDAEWEAMFSMCKEEIF